MILIFTDSLFFILNLGYSLIIPHLSLSSLISFKTRLVDGPYCCIVLSNLHFLAVPKFIAFKFILPFMGLHPSSISYIEFIALYGLISLEFPMLNLLQNKCNIVYIYFIF